MNKLKEIIENQNTRAGKVFDLFIQVLIVVSIISFSLETIPNWPDSTKKLLDKVEIFCIAVFTAEYLSRILVADKKLKFIFSFYGLVDLLAILPAYLQVTFDLRSLRVLRLLRLFRILKLVRYSRAIRRFHLAFLLVKEELILFLTMAGVVVYLSAVGIYHFENEAQPEQFSSVPVSLWWAIVTLTTVGYGDSYPITVEGRIFTFFVLLIGLGVVAVPSGLFASALTKARELEPDSKAEIQEDLLEVRALK
ncbi:MAG: ion transporter [Planctomycetaceae bacterium]|nr:ion transporter [Planctomycetaceae bacterium]